MSPPNGSGPHRNADRAETESPPSAFVTSSIAQPVDITAVVR